MMSFNNRSSHVGSMGGSPNLTSSAVAAGITPTPMESSVVADSKSLTGKASALVIQGMALFLTTVHFKSVACTIQVNDSTIVWPVL
jgi:hypothetical protein